MTTGFRATYLVAVAVYLTAMVFAMVGPSLSERGMCMLAVCRGWYWVRHRKAQH